MQNPRRECILVQNSYTFNLRKVLCRLHINFSDGKHKKAFVRLLCHSRIATGCNRTKIERGKSRIKIVSSCAASANDKVTKKFERRVADSSNNNGTLQMYSPACHIQNTLATRRQNAFYAWINFVYLWWLWFRLPTFGGVGRSRWCRCSHSLRVNNSASCTIVPPIFRNLTYFLFCCVPSSTFFLGARNPNVRSSLPQCIDIAIGTTCITNETFYIYEFGILHSDFYHLNSCDLFFGFLSASSSRCTNRRYRFFCAPVGIQDWSWATERRAKGHLDAGIYGSFYFGAFFVLPPKNLCTPFSVVRIKFLFRYFSLIGENGTEIQHMLLFPARI